MLPLLEAQRMQLWPSKKGLENWCSIHLEDIHAWMLQLVFFGGDQILVVELEALERNGTAENSFSFVLFYIHLQIGKFRLSAWIVRPYHPAKPTRNVENFLGKPMGFPHPFSIPYRSLQMPIDPYRSLQIRIDPYRSL